MKSLTLPHSGPHHDSGFILIFVIVVLGIMGVVLLVLTAGSKTMLFQADGMYLEAVERNLSSSGAVWAANQLAQNSSNVSSQPTELDVAKLTERPSTLSVALVSPSGPTPQIRVAASTQKANRTLTREHVYAVFASASPSQSD